MVHIDRMLGGTNCVVPKIGGWVVSRDRGLGGAYR